MAEPISSAEHLPARKVRRVWRKLFPKIFRSEKFWTDTSGEQVNEYCRFRDTLSSRESTKPLDNTLLEHADVVIRGDSCVVANGNQDRESA
jgi:hypothetical protein